MKFFFLLSLSLILSTGTLTGQEESQKNLYLTDYNQKLIISGFTARKFLFITLKDKEQNVMYMPNNPAELGLGFSWKNSVVSFAYGYGFDFMRDKKLGKTKSLDIQFHHYARRYAVDFFMQRYKGFYLENEKNGSEYIIAPDLDLHQYGIHGQYVFNHSKFSYKAAYVHNEKQLRSAGSLLLGGGIYYTKLRSDTSFVYNQFNNIQFGISIGYTYTWVISSKWFINGAITAGVNIGSESFSTIGKQKLEVYPTVFPRISVGYDHDNWSLGFTYLGNTTFPVFTKDVTMGLISGQFMLSYYKRIYDVPFLSKILD